MSRRVRPNPWSRATAFVPAMESSDEIDDPDSFETKLQERSMSLAEIALWYEMDINRLMRYVQQLHSHTAVGAGLNCGKRAGEKDNDTKANAF
jgi:hypothetical protein